MLKNPFYVYNTDIVDVPGHLHFGEFLLERMTFYGGRVAFVNGITGETVTYKQMAQEAINLSVSLTQMGLRKGDVVAMCSENRVEFWSTVVAIICAGAVVTTVNLTYTKDEFNHTMDIAKPKYIFCSPFAYKAHSDNLKPLGFVEKIIVYGDRAPPGALLYQDLVSRRVDPEEFVVRDVRGQDDTMMILYSSGTTGLPKGVMLTHHNAFLGCIFKDKDVDNLQLSMLMIAPWYHTMGLMGTLNNITAGRTIVYLIKFNEKLYLETVQKYKPNLLQVVPPLAVMLAKSKLVDNYDVSSVVAIFCGAAPLDAEVSKALKLRFPNATAVVQGYGMTESTYAFLVDDLFAPKPGSVGKPLNGVTIKIVDVESRKPLGPNQSGEICVKGHIVMKGYVGKDRGEDFDEEGFYKTGDVGYYDNDRYFFIVDRLKELIKYKGYQVPPAEIEALLLRHPGVRDAGVVGAPHSVAGEVPVAFVVSQPSVSLTEREIVDYVAEKLSNPKHLRGGVRFVDEIPKTSSGKILRQTLRKMLDATKSKL